MQLQLYSQALDIIVASNDEQVMINVMHTKCDMQCANCKTILSYRVGKEGKGVCLHCSRKVTKCSICEQPVSGIYSSCAKCGHGGHILHIENWFKVNLQCSTGCGCFCTLKTL